MIEEFPALCCRYPRGNIDGFGCKQLKIRSTHMILFPIRMYDVGNAGTLRNL
jgi:hypothetical protein